MNERMPGKSNRRLIFILALLGTASDTEIAARLGRHVAVVCIRRQMLGIPNLYWQQRRGRKRLRKGQSSTENIAVSASHP